MENITHFHIANNSDGLRDWLTKKGIEYVSNGHFTSIPIDLDIFQLGVEFGLYREQQKQFLKLVQA